LKADRAPQLKAISVLASPIILLFVWFIIVSLYRKITGGAKPKADEQKQI